MWPFTRVSLLILCFMSVLSLAVSASARKQASPQNRQIVSPGAFKACRNTPIPRLCSQILRSSSCPAAAPLNRQIAIVSSFALNLTSSSYKLAQHLVKVPPPPSAPRLYKGALEDCTDLMSNTMDELRLSIRRISDLNSAHASQYSLLSQIMDAQVSLSASFTYQDTCLDELQQRKALPLSAAQLLKQVGDTSQAVTIALSMADALHHRVSP